MDSLASFPYSKNGKVGAVIVVGAGIAGMQAALDCAEAGLKVYLLEQSSAIGGKMAQLDKTFPTNDCAMCTISPKLVECGRHLNIEVLTNTTLKQLAGKPGSFVATVSRQPRYVETSRCTACGECAKVCPVRVPNQFNAGLDDRAAIYKLYPQAVPNAYAIEKKGVSPCRAACPAGLSAQGYVALIGQRRFEDAIRLIRDRMPFPSACGRICNHRCESECNRGLVDEPVAIMHLKRFAADHEFHHEAPLPAPVPTTQAQRVAVIGSGPAGLTVAHDLAKLGYPVTIFEALPVLGGMLRIGVPPHRLPRPMLDRDIAAILALGVEVRTNTRIGVDLALDDLLTKEGFQAVFIATGAHRSRRLPIPGNDLEGVLLNIEFLKAVNLGQEVKLGKRVVVIGGGNVAFDVARVARRLGATVTLACLEPRDRMLAHPWEIAEAEQEGVQVRPGVTFKRILGSDGRVAGIECTRLASMHFDPEGRLSVEEVPDSTHVLEADTVIMAIGQSPDLDFIPRDSGLEVTRRGLLVYDPETMGTARRGIFAGVFAGGDVVTGTSFVVDAVAAGHKAAISIDRYLQAKPLVGSPVPPRPVVKMTREEIDGRILQGEIVLRRRTAMPGVAATERVEGFAEVETGYTEEMAVAEAQRCLSCGVCSECFECVRVCQAKAVNHEDRERTQELKVGAVILAPGYEVYDASLSEEFGFGRYPNVVTSLQFERLLSASGPTGGHVQRPSDHGEPKKIAFLQCIGSRDQKHGYCSAVCCMYATKEAILARDHVPGTQCSIFQMDMRAYGKGFDAYFQRAKKEYGIAYHRCRISSLKEDPHNRNLSMSYQTEDGRIETEQFDLVVLSVGLEPSRGAAELSATLRIELEENGFCRTSKFAPLDTTRPGVFVCGAFAEPKDIPDSVTQGSAAAARTIQLLSSARGTLVAEKVYPAEADVTREQPRIGVFVCHCGSNIAGVVDVRKVAEHAASLPGVVMAESDLYACSQDNLKNIQEKVTRHRLNRVIVASCTPRTHLPLFQETLREAGLNPYLFEMANIRDQCSWVHSTAPTRATEKARDLVQMAVHRARLLAPLDPISLSLRHEALVIGGGVAGLTAALTLAGAGFSVCLVERERELGGNLRHLRYLLDGTDPHGYLSQLVNQVLESPLITVFTEAEVVACSGFLGNYVATLRSRESGQEVQVQQGVIIVATGGREWRSDLYGLGRHPRVLTLQQFEERLAGRPATLSRIKNVVLIQCLGPGDESERYCSRICCSTSIKGALKIKELNPAANVYVLHKEMRTYGFKEKYYSLAREKGVLFLRYSEDAMPEVRSVEGSLQVSVREPILQQNLALPADLLVLNTAIVPSEGADELATMLKLPRSRDGFFLEAHVKLRPVDFASRGIFLCGLAHYPKFIEETIAQASAAAARAAGILSKERLSHEPIVATVDEEICSGCGICVKICPYGARVLDERRRVAKVIDILCQGCGACAAACPNKATRQRGFTADQFLSMVEAAV